MGPPGKRDESWFTSVYAGVFRFFTMQPNQDDVTLRSVHILQDAEYLDIHGLGLHALKHGKRVSTHAGVNLTDWNRFGYRSLAGRFFSGQCTKSEE